MRKQLLEALKAKFPGVSDAILGRVADKLTKTVTKEEEIQTAVDGVDFQSVLESYGDSRATEAGQSAVANYEKKHGIKNGKKLEDDPDKGLQEKQKAPEGGEDDVPQWARTLIDSNNALTERLNQMETDRTTNSRKQQISALVENLPDNLKKAYNRTPVEGMSDEDFQKLVGEITTEVDNIATEMKQKGVVFGKPSVNNKGGKEDELTDEQVKAISHREGITNAEQPF